MWKDYSSGYIRNNRASGISVMAASFIAALFLSFLCSLFHNFWLDNVESVKEEFGGDWQVRITGRFTAEDLMTVAQYANVEHSVINEELSGERGMVLDIWLYNMRTAHKDAEALTEALGREDFAADYNYQLLSLYFIRIPGDTQPRMLMPAYLAIVAVVCLSLILVIHNSFAVSMDDRVRQFGIFSSIGATPAQLRICLLQEAAALAAGPILVGFLSGILLSFGILKGMSAIVANVSGGRQVSFGLHPAIPVTALLLSFATVLFSAWLPARKLSRLTPLEAIRGTGELQLKKGKLLPAKKHSRILSALFGPEGELAGNALRAQKKALRTTNLSLTLAFLGFMLMQCFFTLSGISTEKTYFARYQDVWDIMITVKNTEIGDFGETEALRALSGVHGVAVYRKADALCVLPKTDISGELAALGGPQAFSGCTVTEIGDSLLLKAPLIILDDETFAEYCEQINVEPRLDGCIVRNGFWDSKSSNFREREYLPYIKEELGTVTLQNAGNAGVADPAGRVEIPVTAFTLEEPVLREEYASADPFELVQFVPLSLWREIKEKLGGGPGDTLVRVLTKERTDAALLNGLEEEAAAILGGKYEIESENRIQERISNNEMIRGYESVMGAFCILLAVIGVANVFSNTQGFLRRRKREFARYMSVGLTPAGIRKMFCIEALALAGRPMLLTLILTGASVCLMTKASHLPLGEFMAVAPAVPIALFILTVFGFVALAYLIGGRRVLKISLSEALRDDTMI